MASFLKPLTICKPGLLLCEGEDEVSFFNAWFTELGVTDVQVLAYQGKTKLAEFLSDLVKANGFGQVMRAGVTRDADEDAGAAFQSLEHAVKSAPEDFQRLNPAIFVLPGNGKPGALESLWLSSLADNPMRECVEDFFRCIEAKGWRSSHTFAKNDKARAQLWIATKDVPNERFGFAAWHGRKDADKPWMHEKWVNFDHPSFTSLKEFILRTFTAPL